MPTKGYKLIALELLISISFSSFFSNGSFFPATVCRGGGPALSCCDCDDDEVRVEWSLVAVEDPVVDAAVPLASAGGTTCSLTSFGETRAMRGNLPLV